MFLSAPCYRTGDPLPLEACAEVAADEDVHEFLRTLGLRTFCASRHAPPELAILAAGETLGAAGVPPADIDAFVYASSSFWNPEFHRRHEVSRMLDTLGLTRAYPVGVTLSECANFPSALRVARALLADGCRHVLLATVDCIAQHDSRIVPPQLSVKSDAAASCLLSAAQGEFHVDALAQVARADLWSLAIDRELERYMVETNASLLACVEQVLSAGHLGTHDLDLVLTNNYNTSVARGYAALLGVPQAKLYTANIARIAHAVAADNLINLRDALDDGRVRSGARVLMIAAAQNLWGGALLRKT
jgi:3-oxoacyl-[acyl-carrier-protein] synthase-3